MLDLGVGVEPVDMRKPNCNQNRFAYSYRLTLRVRTRGPSVLRLHRLLPRLLAAVTLTTASLCLPANAEDYPGHQTLRVAQAGSMGGSIGKTDKSISGGEEQPTPSPRARSSRPVDHDSSRGESLPKAIQLNEHALGMHWSITLHNVGGNNYNGTWSHGYVTSFTMTSFTKTSVTMQRTDKPAVGAVTSNYSGSRNGNHAAGEASHSNGGVSNWDASW